MPRKATIEQELAAAIANQAECIANGTVCGPLAGATARLVTNAETLDAWVRGGVA